MSFSRIYEVMFILKPGLEEKEIDQVIDQLTQATIGQGGEIAKVDKMGNRRLAYKIRKGNAKYTDGYYILLTVNGNGPEVSEIDRKLRVFDLVIRHIIVRIDEDLKKARKLQAHRAARLAKRASRHQVQTESNNTTTETTVEEN